MENNQTDKPVKPQIVVVQSQKSVGISIMLTFLFGSFGLFYSTITGGLIMSKRKRNVIVHCLHN